MRVQVRAWGVWLSLMSACSVSGDHAVAARDAAAHSDELDAATDGERDAGEVAAEPGLSVRIPDATYELASLPHTKSILMLSKPPVAGDPIVGGIEATLFGLEPSSPSAAWPASYDDPAISWRDHDGDGQPGVTALIPTSGRSTRCNLDYTGLPIPSSGTSRAVCMRAVAR